MALLASGLGVSALVLACSGLYGSWPTRCRDRPRGRLEAGLGAERSSVVWMVLRNCLVVSTIGIAIGTGAHWRFDVTSDACSSMSGRPTWCRWWGRRAHARCRDARGPVAGTTRRRRRSRCGVEDRLIGHRRHKDLDAGYRATSSSSFFLAGLFFPPPPWPPPE